MQARHSSLHTVMVGSLISLSLLALGACGSKDAPKPSTQVAAKVGSEEISLHQINAALAQGNSRGATPEQVQVQSRSALEGLIDQQVAVDQAIESKLNRDPDVMAQIESARRGVLANAYVKQYVNTLPKPDAQEAKTYFAEHPALFSERRIYNVQEIVVPRSPEVLEQLNSMAAANQSMEAVTAWLKSRQISASPVSASRAAEQIPLDLLPRLHALKDGQDLVFTAPGAVTFLRLVGSRTEPVAEAAALPRIAQFLGTQRTVDAITAHIKELRSKTSVVYLGAFAEPLPAAAATAPAATAAPATPAASPAKVSSTLEKGVAGLK
ncbi:MAG: peptidyl-prolyl cis-trans isomerase, EpsD family [Rhodoferax sp.]|nr:peptidyl-prolyl cis-trans isomerase, EpsD family [Rhodoferax sp.]